MSEKYIHSPLNYPGGKYKLLSSILPLVPADCKRFVDLFAGGFNVGVNTSCRGVALNDRITDLVELYRYLYTHTAEDVVSRVKDSEKRFGINIKDPEPFLEMRAYYNWTKDPVLFFTLICWSFNHQIRYNGSMEYNSSFGYHKGGFNTSIEKNLVLFMNKLHSMKLDFSTCDFREFEFKEGDFVYLDPPYLLSVGVYNDGKRGFGGWNLGMEKSMYSLLDSLNDRGIRFLLSNVTVHKGVENKYLLDWSKGYKVHYIDSSYSNCSYQLKDRETKTVEVLVSNY